VSVQFWWRDNATPESRMKNDESRVGPVGGTRRESEEGRGKRVFVEATAIKSGKKTIRKRKRRNELRRKAKERWSLL